MGYELLSIGGACAIFVLFWNTRRFLDNGFWTSARCWSSASPSYVSQMDAEIETTSRMISNLMELARSKQSRKQPVDLGRLVEEVTRALADRVVGAELAR